MNIFILVGFVDTYFVSYTVVGTGVDGVKVELLVLDPGAVLQAQLHTRDSNEPIGRRICGKKYTILSLGRKVGLIVLG